MKSLLSLFTIPMLALSLSACSGTMMAAQNNGADMDTASLAQNLSTQDQSHRRDTAGRW